MEVKLDLTFLREWQKEVFTKFKRFNILVIHRRAGKTITALCLVLYKALQEKGSYGYIAPTYKQSKAIAFDILSKFASKLPNTKINISELTVELFNGSKIRLFGADNPDSLRGLDLKGVVFDEYAQQPSSIYGEIVFPMINANNGWCLWIGTPKGKNSFWELYEKAKLDEKYFVKLLTVNDTNLLGEEQLKAARDEMSEDEYNQEYLCSWEASIKGAFYSEQMGLARREGRIGYIPYEPSLNVYTFWDLGLNDTMVIRFIQIYGKEIRVIDHYEMSGEGFEHYIRILRDKPYKYEAHYYPHDIDVRELQSGISRRDYLIRNGITNIKVVPKVSIQEGIDAVRRVIRYCWFDEKKCFRGINALTDYHKEYDDKNKIFRSNPKHDRASNSSDAFRYFALTYEVLTKTKDNNRVIMPSYI